MTSNFLLNNLITYADLRLRGRQFLWGLLSFYLVRSIGAVANVALASLIYREWRLWWVAGTAGAALGAAWNYMGSRLLHVASAASRRIPMSPKRGCDLRTLRNLIS